LVTGGGRKKRKKKKKKRGRGRDGGKENSLLGTRLTVPVFRHIYFFLYGGTVGSPSAAAGRGRVVKERREKKKKSSQP